MAYDKKTWVNVPDPSNPPAIPAGQDALARFDADNMNRIEEGIKEAHIHIEDVSLHNNSTDGGCAMGEEATATYGGAVGYHATASTGAAVGSWSDAAQGAAVGYYAKTSSGAAVGYNAKTVKTDGTPIDAIQLGTGTNNTPKTLQVYDYQLMKADGTIPNDRMPSKAPSGHGLGDNCVGEKSVSFLKTAQNGCGFYRVGQATDAPDGITDWLGTLQIMRDKSSGVETGTQLAFHDFNNSKPRAWLRTIKTGAPSSWVEMLHSGNYAQFANTKIQSGSYTGNGLYGESNKITLTFNFTPKLVILTGKGRVYRNSSTYEESHAFFMYLWGHNSFSGADTAATTAKPSTNGNTLSWYAESNKTMYNISGEKYFWVAIG